MNQFIYQYIILALCVFGIVAATFQRSIWRVTHIATIILTMIQTLHILTLLSK